MAGDFESSLSYALSCLKLENVKLKDKQKESILRNYEGKDVFLWLPTGGYGKSVCFQCLPFLFDHKLKIIQSPLYERSVYLVVSPLLSLMVDQVLSLRARGVQADILRGRYTVPEIFFNERLIGGLEELEELDQLGQLDKLIQDIVNDPRVESLTQYRRPESKEFLELIPVKLRQKWQKALEDADLKLRGSKDKPLSSLLIMLETPEEMVVICSAGVPGTSEFPIGLGGLKGEEGSDRKSYCQVAIEKNQTLFFDGPEKRFRELQNCNDWVKFGYGYYIGAPWSVGQLKGTVVAMEKEPGILNEQHISVIETLRDQLERELKDSKTYKR